MNCVDCKKENCICENICYSCSEHGDDSLVDYLEWCEECETCESHCSCCSDCNENDCVCDNE